MPRRTYKNLFYPAPAGKSKKSKPDPSTRPQSLREARKAKKKR
jgi:hypothetical protein